MSVRDLQLFSVSELSKYDSDTLYMFIFVDIEELNQLSEGYLKVKGDFIQAVDDTEEWIRYNRNSLIENSKAFVVIFQRSALISSGFIDPDIVNSREKERWNKKIDDGFVELRCNKDIVINPIGYCSLYQAVSKEEGDMRWLL